LEIFDLTTILFTCFARVYKGVRYAFLRLLYLKKKNPVANIQDSGKMIVMELAKGGELGEYLEKTGKMTEEKAKGRKIPGAFCMEECLIILDA